MWIQLLWLRSGKIYHQQKIKYSLQTRRWLEHWLCCIPKMLHSSMDLYWKYIELIWCKQTISNELSGIDVDGNLQLCNSPAINGLMKSKSQKTKANCSKLKNEKPQQKQQLASTLTEKHETVEINMTNLKRSNFGLSKMVWKLLQKP